MKVAILTANLGNFDNPVQPVRPEFPQGVSQIVFKRYTDQEFPPITGLTPRLQYRIPKLFGWQMHPGFDVYLWLDSSMSLMRPDSLKWFMEKLGDADVAFFNHPWRSTIKQEVDHIEQKLKEGNKYITSRYKNGLHREQYHQIMLDPNFEDNALYTSTSFIYRDTGKVRNMMELWWLHQSRYFTCDQVALPYVIFRSGVKINVIQEDQFKNPYIQVVSKHR